MAAVLARLLRTGFGIHSGGGVAVVPPYGHAVTVAIQLKTPDPFRIPQIGDVPDGDPAVAPAAAVEEVVVEGDRLNLAASDQPDVARFFRNRAIQNFHPVNPLGDEDDVAGHGDSGRQLHRVEPGEQPRLRRVGEVENPEPLTPGGDVEPVVLHRHLPPGDAGQALHQPGRGGSAEIVDGKSFPAGGIQVVAVPQYRNAVGRIRNLPEFQLRRRRRRVSGKEDGEEEQENGCDRFSADVDHWYLLCFSV